ncbi:methyltransferase [Thiohalocapsa phage LS06-2018-MD03]|nr:methyltransferase [Thiohalocapsa phage LS06-2018-MD03]
MYYPEFKKMVNVHPESESRRGGYKIQHLSASEPSYFEKVYNHEIFGQREQKICVLRDLNKGEIVMSDSWMEQDTNIKIVRAAHGHVLVAGLGIGMILLALQDKPNVKSITVVEISQELHDFIRPNLILNDKVDIVISDIHDYKAPRVFDFVYCDIWNGISGYNLDEMLDLTSKFYNNNEVHHWRYFTTEEKYIESQGLDLCDYELNYGHMYQDFNSLCDEEN